MAFALYVSDGITTTNLSDRNPFAFENLEGVSNGPVVRYVQRGPLQHGVTDRGYRMGPRVLALSLLFTATTDAQLDSYRQQLMDAFKPSDTALTLYYERDDGTTRTCRVHATDEIEITLTPELRPGHTHRARLILRAANPLWTEQDVVRASTIATSSWWLAGGYIDSANVMEHVDSPTLGQAWTYAGTITNSFSIVFRTSPASFGPMNLWPTVFHAGTGALTTTSTSTDAAFYYYNADSDYRWTAESGNDIYGTTMPSGTHNYFGIKSNGYLHAYYDGTAPYIAGGSVASIMEIRGLNRRWRSNRLADTTSFGWNTAVPKAAVYDIALSETQRIALDAAMSSNPISVFTAVNEGDIAAYPVIKIVGPYSGISVTNSTTGESFNFGTAITIADGDTYTIDLRGGDKQVYDSNGVSKLSQVTNPAGLASFRLEPSPVVAGGTNTITVVGSATSATSRVTIEHYNQYVSF